jgi:phosphatidylinositol glycan class N
LEGQRYYETYDWFFLRTIVTLGYLGWIVYCLSSMLTNPVPLSSKSRVMIDFVFAGLTMMMLTIQYLQSATITYYGYTFFPLYFWYRIAHRGKTILKAMSKVSGWSFFASTLVYCLFLESIVS